MRCAILLVAAFSLSCCASIKRPAIDICQVIAADDTTNPRLGCYRFADFNEDGNIKSGIKPHFRSTPSIRALNKHMVIASDAGPMDAIAKFKAYVKKLREAYQDECKAASQGRE